VSLCGPFRLSSRNFCPCCPPPSLWRTGAGPAFPEFVPDFISSPHFSFKSLIRLLLISHGGGLAATRQIVIQWPAKAEAHLTHGSEQYPASGGRGLTPAADLILRWIRLLVSRDGTSSYTVVRCDFDCGLGGGASARRREPRDYGLPPVGLGGRVRARHARTHARPPSAALGRRRRYSATDGRPSAAGGGRHRRRSARAAWLRRLGP
jgi:hypothetical protein